MRKLALQCPPYRPPPSCASAISRSASCSLPHPNVCTCQVRPVRWLQSVAASALERPTAHAHLPNRRNARSVRGAPSNDTRTDGCTGAPSGRRGAGRRGADSAVQPDGTRAYGGERQLLRVRGRKRAEGQRKAAHRHAVRRRRHPRGDVLHDRIRVRLAVRRVAVGEEQNRGARRPAARSALEDPTRITGAP